MYVGYYVVISSNDEGFAKDIYKYNHVQKLSEGTYYKEDLGVSGKVPVGLGMVTYL